MSDGTVILLDLNFTLVENSDERRSPFSRQIQIERYRVGLIKAISRDYVVMITARPHKYRIETLHSIEQKTGWHPDEAFFNWTGERPPDFKRRIVIEHLNDRFDLTACLAVESNPKTRAMYADFGIRALRWDDFLLERAAAV